tara:strand:- start:190 stop:345 length:156 start_codon:yes stop_codon:yes gene_type:complete
MKIATKELQNRRYMAEISLKKTAEVQQVLAQIECSLTSAEHHQVIEKKQKK